LIGDALPLAAVDCAAGRQRDRLGVEASSTLPGACPRRLSTPSTSRAAAARRPSARAADLARHALARCGPQRLGLEDLAGADDRHARDGARGASAMPASASAPAPAGGRSGAIGPAPRRDHAAEHHEADRRDDGGEQREAPGELGDERRGRP
jgi:hypothetical protein